MKGVNGLKAVGNELIIASGKTFVRAGGDKKTTTITELPMVLDTTRRAGKSKLNTRRTMLGYFSLFTRKGPWRARAAKAASLSS